MTSILFSNQPTGVQNDIVNINASDLIFTSQRTLKDGRTVENTGSHLEIAGARPTEGGVEITIRVNLTAIGVAESYEGDAMRKNRWAKAHILVSPDMSGYAQLAAYASATVGRRFEGGALKFEPGEKVNYTLLPVFEGDAYFICDLEQGEDVVIDGQTSNQFVLSNVWFEGVTFVAPIRQLDIQRPVKRQNPLAAATTAAPAAQAPVRRPVSIPAALSR